MTRPSAGLGSSQIDLGLKSSQSEFVISRHLYVDQCCLTRRKKLFLSGQGVQNSTLSERFSIKVTDGRFYKTLFMVVVPNQHWFRCK